MDAEVTIEFSGTEAESLYPLRVTVPLAYNRTTKLRRAGGRFVEMSQSDEE